MSYEAFAISPIATELTKRGWAPATLAFDDLPEFAVNGGGGRRFDGDAFPFVLVATGRATPESFGLDDSVNLKIDGKPFVLPFVKTFASVAVGKPLLYIDSRGRIAVALNQRDFSKTYKITPPVSVFIPRKAL